MIKKWWIKTKGWLLPSIVILAIIAGITTCSVAIRQDRTRREAANIITKAPVLMVIPVNDNNDYTFYFDGFKSEQWSRSYIKLVIDTTIVKGKPSALFHYNTISSNIYEYREMVVSFHDQEDVIKFMGGSTMNVNVKSGRDSHVSVSNSTAESCFISTIGG